MPDSVQPEISVYLCQNCIPEGVRLPRQWRQDEAYVQTKILPCSGKTEAQYLFHALEAGARGVLLVACPEGACKLAQGNYRAAIRIQTVQRLLDEIGMEPERVVLLHCAPGDDLEKLVRDAVQKLCALGESPIRAACQAQEGAYANGLPIRQRKMTEKTAFQEKIKSGAAVLVVETAPPRGADPSPLREAAKAYAGKVNALGLSDNRDGARMSALAAAALVAAEGVEPILHMVTRDRNRLALISECLGAQALGVRNILCTTGTHQRLGSCPMAKNVFDVDSMQLIDAVARLAGDGALVGEEPYADAGPFCLGAVAAPFADPPELQLMRLAKKVAVGAKFLITQPVYDLERFEAWWTQVTQQGLHEKTAILAGIRPLLHADEAKAYVAGRPCPMVPDAQLERLSSAGDDAAQRAAGIEAAVETIEKVTALGGVRGFEICGGDTAAVLEIIERTGLGCS